MPYAQPIDCSFEFPHSFSGFKSKDFANKQEILSTWKREPALQANSVEIPCSE